MKLSKLIVAASLFALPMLVVNLRAQQTGETWNPAGNPTQPSDGLWSTGANWSAPGIPPVTLYKAFFNVNPAIPCVVNGTAGGCQVSIGDGGPGILVVTNGGNLTCGDGQNTNIDLYGWTAIGYSAVGTMIIEPGATVTFAYHVWIGLTATGNGTLIMNGGTATITNGNGAFGIGTSGGTGSVTLNGGSLNINNNLQLPLATTGQINLAGGSLILAGNATGTVTPLISANKIWAYGGTGTVNVDTQSMAGFTVLTGVGGSTPPSSSQITFTSVHSGGAVTIIYNSTISAPYHIESTASLSPPSWATVSGSSTNATATSTSFSFTDPSTRDFYRIVSP